LGDYVWGKYYPSVILLALNYVSIILATIIFAFITIKFIQAEKKNKLTMEKVRLA